MAVMETLSGSGKVGDRTFDYIDFDPWPSEYAESQGSSPSPPTLPTSTDQLQFSMAFPTRMAPSSFAGASQNVSPLQDQVSHFSSAWFRLESHKLQIIKILCPLATVKHASNCIGCAPLILLACILSTAGWTNLVRQKRSNT